MPDRKPSILVFDVNETLLDLEHLTPLFARVFTDGRIMREWFAQMILYSEAVTMAGLYVPFGSIGAGALQMVGRIRGISLKEADIDELRERMTSLPAHVDAEHALRRLKEAGFRLATLTNSAPSAGPSPLAKAGLASFFEEMISVDEVGCFKPAPETYSLMCRRLGAAPVEIGFVAAHVWDTIGAQACGCSGALVDHGVNAPLPIDGLPQPDIVAPTLTALADAIIADWR